MPAGPFVAVIGNQDAAPGRGNADRGSQQDRQSWPLGEVQRDRRRADQQSRGEHGADGDGRESDGQRHHDQVQQPDQPHRHATHGREVRIERAEQQRPVQHANRDQRTDPHHQGQRDNGRRDREHRPEHHGDGGTRGAAGRHVQIKKQRREAEPGAGHDARHQVALARAIDADQFHARRREHAHAEEPEQRIDPEQERGRAAGAADIGQGVAGEGLPPDDGKHADHAGDNGGGGTDRRRRAHRLAGEEPGLEQD